MVQGIVKPYDEHSNPLPFIGHKVGYVTSLASESCFILRYGHIRPLFKELKLPSSNKLHALQQESVYKNLLELFPSHQRGFRSSADFPCRPPIIGLTLELVGHHLYHPQTRTP